MGDPRVDEATLAFRRVLAAANAGEQARVDALVTLVERSVFVATWPGPNQAARTLTNSHGESALPLFTGLDVLDVTASRFGWRHPDGSLQFLELAARDALLHGLARHVHFVVVDMGCDHSVEFAREEVEPLLAAASPALSVAGQDAALRDAVRRNTNRPPRPPLMAAQTHQGQPTTHSQPALARPSQPAMPAQSAGPARPPPIPMPPMAARTRTPPPMPRVTTGERLIAHADETQHAANSDSRSMAGPHTALDPNQFRVHRPTPAPLLDPAEVRTRRTTPSNPLDAVDSRPRATTAPSGSAPVFDPAEGRTRRTTPSSPLDPVQRGRSAGSEPRPRRGTPVHPYSVDLRATGAPAVQPLDPANMQGPAAAPGHPLDATPAQPSAAPNTAPNSLPAPPSLDPTRSDPTTGRARGGSQPPARASSPSAPISGPEARGIQSGAYATQPAPPRPSARNDEPTLAERTGTQANVTQARLAISDTALQALCAGLRGFPEVEWACVLSDGSEIPFIAVRVDPSYLNRVADITDVIMDVGDQQSLTLQVLLLNNQDLVKRARKHGHAFYPWRR
jgi:hypothetical protein